MMKNHPFTLYSPQISGKKHKVVIASDLKDQLLRFYQYFKPISSKTKFIDYNLSYARKQGVLALRSALKKRYNFNLDDADPTPRGYARLYKNLEEYYAYYSPEGEVEVLPIVAYAKREGLFALDKELKGKYKVSFSEFMSRDLFDWKNNWKSVLSHIHEESITYELKRFYSFIETLPKKYTKTNSLDDLVQWAILHSRMAVNEKLLQKYCFGLDDVKMIKGTTMEDRVVNLKTQLIEFYQEHDPTLIGRSSAYNYGDNESEAPNPQLEALERAAEDGVIKLEELNQVLFNKYGRVLEDNMTRVLRGRLIDFYESVGVQKSPENIEKLVDFAAKNGLQEMNQRLNLTYGKAIVIEDL